MSSGESKNFDEDLLPQWAQIMDKVLEDYDDYPVFTLNYSGVFPGAALTLSRIDPKEYEDGQPTEAFRAITDYLLAHCKKGDTSISNVFKKNLHKIPEGEDPLLDMILGRTEPTHAGIAESILYTMEDYTRTTVIELRSNYEAWEPIANNVIDGYHDGIQIEDPSS